MLSLTVLSLFMVVLVWAGFGRREGFRAEGLPVYVTTGGGGVRSWKFNGRAVGDIHAHMVKGNWFMGTYAIGAWKWGWGGGSGLGGWNLKCRHTCTRDTFLQRMREVDL